MNKDTACALRWLWLAGVCAMNDDDEIGCGFLALLVAAIANRIKR